MKRSFGYSIDSLRPADWDEVRAIYLEGILTGQATFETEAPDWEQWDASRLKDCRLVARFGDVVAGWAALSPVSGRRVYAGVTETSIYIAERFRGLGPGRLLLEALIECSEQHGIWTLQAGIFPENVQSLTLYRKCGFREVGRRERLGMMDGHWRDVILMERRSRIVGAE